MAHPFLHSYFQGVVGGITTIGHANDRAKVRVKRRSTLIRWEEEVPDGSLCWEHDVHVINPEWLVNTACTHITHQCRQVRGEFALHVEVPLHNVITMWMRFHVRHTSTCRTS